MKARALRVTILGLNYSPEPTGNAPYTAALAEALQSRGFHVRVVTSHPHYPEWKVARGYGQWSRSELINQVQVTRLRHFVPKRPNGIQRLISEITFGVRLLFADWGKPDLVLLVSPALISSAMALTRARIGLRRPTTAIWVQDLYSLGIVETGSGGGPAEWVLKTVERATLRGVDGVAVIHQRFASHVVQALGVRPTAVEVIRNWTHLPPAPPSDRKATRVSRGWSDSEIVVLHAGNMGKKQGLENVLEAAQLADEMAADVRFVLMGDGSQRESLLASGVGVERIEFIDSLPTAEFQATLAAADILLVNELPGVSEMAVPSKLTSYFSAGVPVIAATDDASVTAGEIKASGGGIRVDPGDPGALLRGVVSLGEDSVLSAELGKSGRKYRDAVLSQDGAIDHYAGWLVSLAAKRGR